MRDEFLDVGGIRVSTFVRHVEVHETLGSTNDRAREIAHNPEVELPALIVARNQTAGRGRGTNVWHSAEGALTFSLILDAHQLPVPKAKWPLISLTTALAVCDALIEEIDRKSPTLNPKLAGIGIKWPNDVMLHAGKVAGILVESSCGSDRKKDRLIIGVGLNINNAFRADNAVQHLERTKTTSVLNAISLRDATGRVHDLNRILCRFLCAVKSRIAQLELNDPCLPADWCKLDWLTERSVEVRGSGRTIEGICTGINHEGALIVENGAGEHAIHSGSVQLRP
jgi:BirA family biotin operon repressor/biotin-[acetyl-CoA-carboxylase] ligase